MNFSSDIECFNVVYEASMLSSDNLLMIFSSLCIVTISLYLSKYYNGFLDNFIWSKKGLFYFSFFALSLTILISSITLKSNYDLLRKIEISVKNTHVGVLRVNSDVNDFFADRIKFSVNNQQWNYLHYINDSSFKPDHRYLKIIEGKVIKITTIDDDIIIKFEISCNK